LQYKESNLRISAWEYEAPTTFLPSWLFAEVPEAVRQNGDEELDSLLLAKAPSHGDISNVLGPIYIILNATVTSKFHKRRFGEEQYEPT
jgi:hypothetical protein